MNSIDSAPHLQVRGPDGFEETVLIREGETLIGRDPSCDVVLEPKNVSRRHLVIRREGDGFVVQDLGSANGTMLNDDLLGASPRPFRPGDCVTVSPYEIRLVALPAN